MGATELILVRHGESLGNVAAAEARQSGAEVIDVPARDADVDLSPTGVEQAQALGRWLRERPGAERPDAVWSSPFRRAHDTARTALDVAGLDLPVRLDERLRDRDLGITDTLTDAGVRNRYPEEAERREWLGKFYYRPSGGESWADIALRVRSVLADLERQRRHRRVLITCHDAVLLVFRYVCEGMDEATVLDVGRTSTVRNAAVTRLVREEDADTWTLAEFNAADHLRDRGVPVTAQHSPSDEQVPSEHGAGDAR
ncbi:Broad specificity phosphatase PhoE [Georgenia satyanarayanai]|uniref:Broad specificity phosphatase PhoE n=1 Tax=Georgenia satyanarayanai TaxID=860221 RepID=A0A2Y9APL5_9MICO|nr:histidine phosphatase family protein [Georgenia satyanarayanai]PYF97248.1 broad specificity phosphatase PhoE [Georgenia satyanarayanai]SSA46334.1 Broad specificity phosphatase PhoE [Georgenia satyanarayanai]